MSFRPRSPDRPVPAVVLLRLRDPRDDGGDFIGLSTAMLSAGLIHDEPRELRRTPLTPGVLELVCTFVDGVAVRAWREKVKTSLAALAPKLAGTPIVRRYRDVILDFDHVGTCRCPAPSWLVLDAPCLVEPGSALVCGDCHERLPSYSIPPELGCESWAYVYGKVYEIWIRSGVLEQWSLTELGSMTSELNRTATKIARKTARQYGVRVLPRVFTEGDRTNCPRCARVGTELGWRSLTRCGRCRIVY